jgi:hypothetical protein
VRGGTQLSTTRAVGPRPFTQMGRTSGQTPKAGLFKVGDRHRATTRDLHTKKKHTGDGPEMDGTESEAEEEEEEEGKERQQQQEEDEEISTQDPLPMICHKGVGRYLCRPIVSTIRV